MTASTVITMPREVGKSWLGKLHANPTPLKFRQWQGIEPMKGPLIRAVLMFYPKQKNPARASGYGVYRVKRCYPVHQPVFDGNIAVFRNREYPTEPAVAMLYLTADREYKRGSRVDPLKIALAVNQGRV